MNYVCSNSLGIKRQSTTGEKKKKDKQERGNVFLNNRAYHETQNQE